MINHRAAKITLDHLAGKPFPQLAAEHNIGIARIGQIVTTTLQQLQMTHKPTLQAVGCAIARRREREPDDIGDTPRSFYWDELRTNLPAPSHYWRY